MYACTHWNMLIYKQTSRNTKIRTQTYARAVKNPSTHTKFIKFTIHKLACRNKHSEIQISMHKYAYIQSSTNTHSLMYGPTPKGYRPPLQ